MAQGMVAKNIARVMGWTRYLETERPANWVDVVDCQSTMLVARFVVKNMATRRRILEAKTGNLAEDQSRLGKTEMVDDWASTNVELRSRKGLVT